MKRLLTIATLCISLVAAAEASAATSLIAAYDHYVSGQGFQIGLVDVGTGQSIAVPAGVNTTQDEIHPALTPDGRFLVFTRMQLQPQLNGDVVPPSERTLVMVDRSTGQSGEPVPGEDNSGAGATITPGPAGQDRLAFGLRPPFPRASDSTSRIVTAARREGTSFVPLASDHRTIGGPTGSEEIGQVLDVPAATLVQRSAGPVYGHVKHTFDPATGENRSLTLSLNVPPGTSTRTGLDVGGAGHPALRAPDGYAAIDRAAAGLIQTVNFPASGTLAGAPSPINTSSLELMPAWSPDGLKLAFVRMATSNPDRKLLVYDATPGIQTIQNPGIDLGTPAPTTQLRSFHDIWGGISLAVAELPSSVNLVPLPALNPQPVDSSITLTPRLTTNTTTITGLGSIGILVAKVVGRRRVLGRRVPRLKPLGRVPLGRARRGRNRFRWNGRVAGRRLKPGVHVLTFRSLTRRGRIQSVSQTVQFRVTRSRRITSLRVLR
jgi:hypothetical protein